MKKIYSEPKMEILSLLPNTNLMWELIGSGGHGIPMPRRRDRVF